MRHAKAEQMGPTDFDRALAARGHADAQEAGSWLSGHGFSPDRALVSAALRTRETWAAVADGGGWDLDADLDRGLYSAEPDTAIDLVQQVDDEVRRLVLIGHNPTMAYLAQLLGDGTAAADLERELMSGFPTSALAVFAQEQPWAELTEGSARLIAFHVGRA
ncbi:MAG: histidine phosphatase family protein [Nocardioides sp.]|nr:histidine phosphatase family protein [Nocardioides sp.]